MSLSWIAIIIGTLAVAGSGLALFKPEILKKGIERFPRSTIPAWVLTALCCWMGASEAFDMNMGDLINPYKKYIPYLAIAVFLISIFYMKELLAARSLGGFLLLIAVPVLENTIWHESQWRLVIVTIVYIWIVFGIMLLMSPWYYRKTCALFINNEKITRVGAVVKLVMGIFILILGIFVF